MTNNIKKSLTLILKNQNILDEDFSQLSKMIKSETPVEEENIELIRKQEYLLQLKSEVNFPIYKILTHHRFIKENEEYKLKCKVRIFTDNSYDYETSLLGFIFIFTDKIILTTEDIQEIKTDNIQNPVLYSIFFNCFIAYKLIENELTSNSLYIKFYTNKFSDIKEMVIKFLDNKDSYFVHHFIKKYFILQWQIFFESTLLKEYEQLIYNKHFIIIESEAKNTLLVSNLMIFNLSHNYKLNELNFSFNEVIYILGIKAITKIIILNNNDIQIFFDYIENQNTNLELFKIAKYANIEDQIGLKFLNNEDLNEFLYIIELNYKNITNKELDINTKDILKNNNL